MSRKLNKNRKTQRKATPRKTSKYLSKTVEANDPNIMKLLQFKKSLNDIEDQNISQDEIINDHINFLGDFEKMLKDNGYTES